ncbi:MAG: ERF family protein [Myxococcota bacterium]
MTRRKKKKAEETLTQEQPAHGITEGAGDESGEVAQASSKGAVDDTAAQLEPIDTTKIVKPLALKMARVMAEVRNIPKKGRNDFHDYNYIMESDLVDHLRGKLAEQGVAIFPSIREHKVTHVEGQRGRTQYLATVTLELTFIDGETGDQMTTSWVGQGADQGDKSYYKAYTGAFKHALLKTFLITGEAQPPMPRRSGRRQGAS